MKQYLENVTKILIDGEKRPDRTGTGTVSLFNTTFSHEMEHGFPLMTHKRMSVKSIFAELVWFLSGDTNSHNLEELGSKVWKEFAALDGEIGPMYGASWRGNDAAGVDQIAVLLSNIKNDPYSRRHYMSAWRVESLPESGMSPSKNAEAGRMSLAPCHTNSQFYVSMTGKLSLTFTMRSSDTLLGAPYNIASYGALLSIMAFLTDLEPGTLTANFGDSHIYMDHVLEGQAHTIVNAKTYPLPIMDLSESKFLVAARDKVRKLSKESRYIGNYSEVLDVLFVDNTKEILKDLCNSIKGYTHGPVIKMNVSV